MKVDELRKNNWENTVNADKLLNTAKEKTGYSDFIDNKVVYSLKKLVYSFEKDFNRDIEQRKFFTDQCIHYLENYLKIENCLNQNPDILDTDINQPVFIVGLRGSGITLLHHLLSQDYNNRVLRYWELLNPIPSPEETDSNTDSRIQEAQKVCDEIYHNRPDLKKIYELTPESPEECKYLFLNIFQSEEFVEWFNLVSYDIWLNTQDKIYAYEYYKKMLQILLYKYNKKRTILKYPGHLFALDSIIKIFPNSKIIWVHRDLIDVFSTQFSLLKHKNLILESEIILNKLKRMANSTNDALKIYNYIPSENIYNVYYNDLVNKPMDLIKSIYKHFNFKYDPEMENNVEKWKEKNTYLFQKSSDYSIINKLYISVEKIYKLFNNYCEKFNIENKNYSIDKYKEKKNIKFCILSAPRSGSNLLVGNLEEHSKLICHYEPFNKIDINMSEKFKLLSKKVQLKLNMMFQKRKSDLKKCLTYILADSEDYKNQIFDVYGFKYLGNGILDVLDLILDDNEILIILLERKNRLKSYSSFKIALQSNEWVLNNPKDKGNKPQIKIEFDYEDFCEYCNNINNYFSTIKKRLETNGFKYLYLTYTDLISNKNIYNEIFDFLCLERIEKFNEKHFIQNSKNVLERFSNPSEVIQKLSQEEKEAYLDNPID